MSARSRFLFTTTISLLLSLLFTNCSREFKSTIDNAVSNQQSLDNGESGAPIVSTPNNSLSCAVTVSSNSISQYEPLSLSISSSESISKIETSINNSTYSSLGLTRGSYTWPAGYFSIGSTILVFRGQSTNGQLVNCTPSTQTITVYSAQSPTPAPTPLPQPTPNSGNGSSPSNGIIDRNYVALTGYTANSSAFDAGFKNFKTIYHPDNLTLIDVAADFAPGVKCYNMQIRHHANSLRSSAITQKYRVFIPPGTKYFDMMTLTYWDQTTKQAIAVKMDSAPISTYSETLSNPNLPGDSAEMTRILEKMMAGQEYRSYINEGGNALPRITGGTMYGGSTPYLYQTTRAGWMYINQLKLIGDVAMNLEIRLCVDPPTYKNWYNSAQWDSDGNPL